MTQSRKARVVEGFDTIQALRRTTAPAAEPAAAEAPAALANPPALGAARFGRTTVPERRELVCYGCGYVFVLTGSVHQPLCPRCRLALQTADITVEGNCDEPLRTVGTLRLAAGATLKGGELVATDIVLLGRVETGRVRCSRRLELGPAAVFDIAALTAPQLVIQAGAQFEFAGTTACRGIEIRGALTATLAAEGLVRICAGGALHGAVRAPRLIVEEGAALCATVCIAASTPPAGA